MSELQKTWFGQPPGIEFKDLSKAYGPVKAVQSVSFKVERGEILGFLGPNGAGKTTVMRCLLDLLRPSSGQALVMGFDSYRDSLAARRCVGYLPGELSFYEGLTGRQTVEYFASLRADGQRERLRELVERMQLNLDVRVGSYSKGNRQKLGLVLALMHEPQVIVLDEPTSGLDPLVQEELADILNERVADGASVFFSSHVLSEVERLCHRVAIIRGGRLIAVEDVSQLKGRSLHIVEVTFAEPVPEGVFDSPGVREVARAGRTVHLEVRSGLDAALKAIASYQVVDLRTEQPSLEQVFLTYYHDSIDDERLDDAS